MKRAISAALRDPSLSEGYKQSLRHAVSLEVSSNCYQATRQGVCGGSREDAAMLLVYDLALQGVTRIGGMEADVYMLRFLRDLPN
jgi:hypothetical protein